MSAAKFGQAARPKTALAQGKTLGLLVKGQHSSAQADRVTSRELQSQVVKKEIEDASRRPED